MVIMVGNMFLVLHKVWQDKLLYKLLVDPIIRQLLLEMEICIHGTFAGALSLPFIFVSPLFLDPYAPFDCIHSFIRSHFSCTFLCLRCIGVEVCMGN